MNIYELENRIVRLARFLFGNSITPACGGLLVGVFMCTLASLLTCLTVMIAVTS